MPRDCYKWLKYSEYDASKDNDEARLPEGEGDYAEFAKTLFKLNNYRPGAIAGWYVVMCLEENKAWGIGQLRADAFTPMQVFEDLIYANEEDARKQAEEMRKHEVNVIERDTEIGPFIQKMADEAKAREQEWREINNKKGEVTVKKKNTT